jgi:hypothetical protein
MKAVYYDHKGRYIDKIKKFFIYKEAIKGIQLNDENIVIYNKIFGTVLQRE